jgi:UPF0271 protein
LVSRILDASAFYAGVPFGSSAESYTTSLVFEEIKHIKKAQDALGILIETNRLKVKDPDKKFVDTVIQVAKDTGDYNQLSQQDISVLALSVELRGVLVTDDFSVSNVAKNMRVIVVPIMTSGIKKVGKWLQYCPACKKSFRYANSCPLCGNPLKKKLV